MAFIIKGADTGIYGCYFFDTTPTLDEVVKAMGWGNNKDIRNGVFKIEYPGEDYGLIKNWPVINEPNTLIEDGTVLVKGKGSWSKGQWRGPTRVRVVRPYELNKRRYIGDKNYY